jgi:hypothetical protein
VARRPKWNRVPSSTWTHIDSAFDSSASKHLIRVAPAEDDPVKGTVHSSHSDQALRYDHGNSDPANTSSDWYSSFEYDIVAPGHSRWKNVVPDWVHLRHDSNECPGSRPHLVKVSSISIVPGVNTDDSTGYFSQPVPCGTQG